MWYWQLLYINFRCLNNGFKTLLRTKSRWIGSSYVFVAIRVLARQQWDSLSVDHICRYIPAILVYSTYRVRRSSPVNIQALLGRSVEVTGEDDVIRSTFGIEITTMQLSGKDLFSVWDFAGQVESFITHQFFISTQSTVFTVLVDLTTGLEEQRAQLMCWLGFVKMRNLGQVSATLYITALTKFQWVITVLFVLTAILFRYCSVVSTTRSTCLNNCYMKLSSISDRQIL